MAIKDSKSLSSVGLDGDVFGSDGGTPTESLANLMDVMLVFACGLIVALVAHYGVQLGSAEVEGNMQAIDASEIQQASQSESERDGDFDEVGKVYRDAATGQLYVVTPHGESLDEG